jgi:hypothetical protein
MEQSNLVSRGLILFVACLFITCGEKETKRENDTKQEDETTGQALVIPDNFLGNWLEYHLEKSILFEVCNPRIIELEQGGTEFFWMSIFSGQQEIKYRIHRLKDDAGALLMYMTPKGSLQGTDTTLVIMEPVHVTAGVMRVREYGRSSDYPNETGSIYFVGNPEVVSPNTNPDPCDD